MHSQQVRQVPVFLGRRRRSADDSESTGLSSSSSAPLSSTEKEWKEWNATDAPEPTTQVIEFTLDGQHERFIVAQEVKVDVYPQDPLFDDYSLGPDPVSSKVDPVPSVFDPVSSLGFSGRGSQLETDDKADNDLR